jgi:hypothetical protein
MPINIALCTITCTNLYVIWRYKNIHILSKEIIY